MRSFGVFQGFYYAFPRGTFDKKTLRFADTAAKIFELDPKIIYTKESLDKILLNKIAELDGILRTRLPKKSQLSLRHIPALLISKATENMSILSEGLIKPAVALWIARNMKQNPESSAAFFGRSILKNYSDEVKAAEFLVKRGLV